MKQTRKRYDNMDITGETFNFIQVFYKCRSTRSLWHCRCILCGKEFDAHVSDLIHKNYKSCGCLHKKINNLFGDNNRTHGWSKTKLYHAYRSMLDRCYNPNCNNYKNYGARGIRVCANWRSGFEPFLEWSLSEGYDESKDNRLEQSLDRIDVNGDYCPENCRWATAKTQQKNRRGVTLYDLGDQKITAADLSRIVGEKDPANIYCRLKRGRTPEDIIYEYECRKKLPEHLMECKDYAKIIGVTTNHVTKLLANNNLKGEKIGRKWFVLKNQQTNTNVK